MLFSSLIFTTVFLPIVLVIYYILDKKFKNFFLLIVSLFFYSWGEPRLFFVMIISIMINYIAGLLINYAKERVINQVLTHAILAVAIAVNLGMLVYYKYFNFFINALKSISYFRNIDNDNIFLPIGISFFTFHSISYLVDLYRGQASVQKSLINLGLYIAFF